VAGQAATISLHLPARHGRTGQRLYVEETIGDLSGLDALLNLARVDTVARQTAYRLPGSVRDHFVEADIPCDSSPRPPNPASLWIPAIPLPDTLAYLLSFRFWDSVFRRGAARDAVGHNQETIGLHVLGQNENGFRFCMVRYSAEHAEPGRRCGLAVPEE
jgi:hypothetical protein